MIHAIKHEIPYDSDEYAHPKWDFPYGDKGWEYVRNFYVNEFSDKTDCNFCHLNLWNMNPWKALRYAGVQVENFYNAVSVSCPYIQTLYSAAVPVAILTTNLNSYNIDDVQEIDAAFDVSWNRKMNLLPLHENPNDFLGNVVRALMGSGYTRATLAHDGINSIGPTIVNLSNEDYLLAYRWFWYNK